MQRQLPHIIAIMNAHGGAGKTTTAVAMAKCLARRDRTLLIDQDPQCCASEAVLGSKNFNAAIEQGKTINHLLMRLTTGTAAINYESYAIEIESSQPQSASRLFALPSTSGAGEEEILSLGDQPEVSSGVKLGDLNDWLMEAFEYVVVDCASTFSPITKFMLQLCDSILIPCVPDQISVMGAEQLVNCLVANQVHAKVLGILWTMVRDTDGHKSFMTRSITKEDPFKKLPQPLEPVISFMWDKSDREDIAHLRNHQSELSQLYEKVYNAIF